MTIIDSQAHAYEANTRKRPWNMRSCASGWPFGYTTILCFPSLDNTR